MIRSIILPFVMALVFVDALSAQDSDCNHPTAISLPFSITNASTCNAGNNLTASPCSNALFLASQDFFFSYQSAGEECISLELSNVTEGTGIGIYYGCPDTASTCLAQVGGVPGVTDVSLNAVFLPWAGTYYLVVDNAVACTSFDLKVEKVDCPVVFPPSANCAQAISMNGCNAIVEDLHIAAGEGDPDFLQNGINNGCWEGSFPFNYTWFSFQAANAGQFAFTMYSLNAMNATDLDFQIWGPVSSEDSLCLLAAGTQPVRSSFAAGEEPTGLAAIHPVLNIPVTDFCENASGDDFVAPLDVLPGEWYLVLVNDWGGGLANGTVSIDFSGTDPGVLGEPLSPPLATRDTSICPGDSLLLWASGGAHYQWIADDELSCIYCQTPLAHPDSSQTYSVVISSLCRSDTLSTMVDIRTKPQVLVSPDTLVCGLEPVELMAIASSGGAFTWFPDSIAGNSFTPSPEIGTHSYTVIFIDDSGCFEEKDTVEVEWLGELPVNGLLFLPNDTLFPGNELVIKPDSIGGNLSYFWEEPVLSNSDSISVQPAAAGLFEVQLTVSDSFGCTKVLSSEFVVLPIQIDFPNVFTPNADAYNQVFGPVISGKGVEPVSLKIWNRWGQLVHSSDGANGWDGRLHGEPANADVYIYRMELRLPSGKHMVQTGEVTLLR